MPAKKAKPSPKTGKLLAMVKKAKRPSKVNKLLAQVNKAVKASLEGLLFCETSDLPQVEVPIITSTQVGTGPPKKLKVPVEFIAALNQGNDEILKNTAGFKQVKDLTDLKLVDIAGVPTVTGKATFTKDETPDLAHAGEDIVAQLVKNFKEAADSVTPITTVQGIADWMADTAKIVFDFIHWQPPSKELLVKVREYIEDGYDKDLIPRMCMSMSLGAPGHFPKAGIVRSLGVRIQHMLIDKYGDLPDEADHLFATVFPLPDAKDLVALAKAGLPIGPHDFIIPMDEDPPQDVEATVKELVKLVGSKASGLYTPFTPDMPYTQEGIPYLPVYTTIPMDGDLPQIAVDELEAWMYHTVASVLNCLQFEPFDVTAMFQVRDLIAKHIVDTTHSGGVGPPALFKTLGSESILYRTGLRLREALETAHGKLTAPQVEVFSTVFPAVLPAIGPQEPTFIKSQEELEAVFGKPDPENEKVRLVAALLKNTKEYLDAHPEAAGVDPAGVDYTVQKLVPHAAPYMQLDPEELGVGAAKKLQPKFSKEAEEDAKENGLGEAAAEALLNSLSVSDVFQIPPLKSAEFIELEPVLDQDGNLLSVEVLKSQGIDQLTPKGLATLNRFGVVLKGAS